MNDMNDGVHMWIANDEDLYLTAKNTWERLGVKRGARNLNSLWHGRRFDGQAATIVRLERVLRDLFEEE